MCRFFPFSFSPMYSFNFVTRMCIGVDFGDIFFYYVFKKKQKKKPSPLASHRLYEIEDKKEKALSTGLAKIKYASFERSV